MASDPHQYAPHGYPAGPTRQGRAEAERSKAKRNLAIALAAMAVVAATVLGFAAWGQSTADPGDDAAADFVADIVGGERDVKPAAGINEAARDGDLEFRVTKADCGSKQVGVGTSASRAKGIYCLVTMTITNRTGRGKTFLANNQIAMDAAGNTYVVSGVASMQASKGSEDIIIPDLRPGESATKTLAFDVPTGTSLAAITLHELDGSRGVKVALK